MNVSGIRPVSGFYNIKTEGEGILISALAREIPVAPRDDTAVSLLVSKAGEKKTFGDYDVVRLHKSFEGIRPKGIDRAFSQAEVNKAVNVMKRDESLHKYQKFVGESMKAGLIRTGETENFTL